MAYQSYADEQGAPQAPQRYRAPPSYDGYDSDADSVIEQRTNRNVSALRRAAKRAGESDLTHTLTGRRRKLQGGSSDPRMGCGAPDRGVNSRWGENRYVGGFGVQDVAEAGYKYGLKAPIEALEREKQSAKDDARPYDTVNSEAARQQAVARRSFAENDRANAARKDQVFQDKIKLHTKRRNFAKYHDEWRNAMGAPAPPGGSGLFGKLRDLGKATSTFKDRLSGSLARRYVSGSGLFDKLPPSYRLPKPPITGGPYRPPPPPKPRTPAEKAHDDALQVGFHQERFQPKKPGFPRSSGSGFGYPGTYGPRPVGSGGRGPKRPAGSHAQATAAYKRKHGCSLGEASAAVAAARRRGGAESRG